MTFPVSEKKRFLLKVTLTNSQFFLQLDVEVFMWTEQDQLDRRLQYLLHDVWRERFRLLKEYKMATITFTSQDSH